MDWKTNLFNRITDRAFLLTVAVLIMAKLGNWSPEQVVAGMGVIAPFILGEKFKDAKAIQASIDTASSAASTFSATIEAKEAAKPAKKATK